MMKTTRSIFFILMAMLLAAPAWAQFTPDWGPEGFEGGSPCGLEETWVETPATITEGGATMTGDCWLDAGNARYIAESGLAAAEMHWQFDLRASASTSNAEFFQEIYASDGTTELCRFMVNASNLVRVMNGGTTTNTDFTMTAGQIYTVETRAQQGTGANAECQIRFNGGAWKGTTNGTWTAAIDIWRMRGDGAVHFDFDDISRCAAGAVGDGACDAAPAPVIRTDAGVFFKHGVKGRYRIQPVNYPDAEEEAAYTLSPLPSVVNGETPYIWSIISGAAPRGFSIEGGACE